MSSGNGEKEEPLAPVPDDERERRVAELSEELRPAEERERLPDDEQS